MEKIYEEKNILIPLFFREVLKSFSFPSTDSGYTTEWGIDAYENGKLVKTSEEKINNESWYFSVVRFCKNNIKLSIKYGEREFIISATIAYDNDIYGLGEIVRAVNMKEERSIGNCWVLNSDFLVTTIKELASVTRDYREYLESPSPELFEKIKKEREKRDEHYTQINKKNEIERACVQAAEEFQKDNFSQTVDILQKYENELPKSALLKLHYARKRLP